MQDTALYPIGDEAAQFLRAMAHPARLRIVCVLHNGESAARVRAKLAGFRPPALLQHAASLEAVGLASRQRVRQSMIYRPASPHARHLAQLLGQIYCRPARRRLVRRLASGGVHT